MASASFEAALSAVLVHEGGYSDHPRDPGGATMMGITRATLAAWRDAPVTKDDVRALTRNEVAAIYRSRYWDVVRADELPAGLDLAVFDYAVNSGPLRAIRALQTTLGVIVDGRVGPLTLGAAKAADAPGIIRAVCAGRLGFLRRIATFAVFGRGWSKRVHAIEVAALALASGAIAAPAAAPTAKTQVSKPQAQKEMKPMDLTKTVLMSRTIWANLIGLIALGLSWFGFDTSGLDKGALADTLLQVLAGISFIASSACRVLATKRLV